MSKSFKVSVTVLPKNEVLDSQGRAIGQVLSEEGFSLNSCNIGKYIILDINADNEDQAWSEAKKMTEFVLYNPLIENVSFSMLKA